MQGCVASRVCGCWSCGTRFVSRLRILARRDSNDRPVMIKVGSLRLDPATRRAWRREREIRLSTRELALLEAFMRSPGQVLSPHQLQDAAWNIEHHYRSNVIEVYVRYLREKIDRPFGVRSLETVRGLGYRLRRDGGV
jgi:two-component system, OmpR family, response regulator